MVVALIEHLATPVEGAPGSPRAETRAPLGMRLRTPLLALLRHGRTAAQPGQKHQPA